MTKTHKFLALKPYKEDLEDLETLREMFRQQAGDPKASAPVSTILRYALCRAARLDFDPETAQLAVARAWRWGGLKE